MAPSQEFQLKMGSPEWRNHWIRNEKMGIVVNDETINNGHVGTALALVDFMHEKNPDRKISVVVGSSGYDKLNTMTGGQLEIWAAENNVALYSKMSQLLKSNKQDMQDMQDMVVTIGAMDNISGSVEDAHATLKALGVNQVCIVQPHQWDGTRALFLRKEDGSVLSTDISAEVPKESIFRYPVPNESELTTIRESNLSRRQKAGLMKVVNEASARQINVAPMTGTHRLDTLGATTAVHQYAAALNHLSEGKRPTLTKPTVILDFNKANPEVRPHSEPGYIKRAKLIDQDLNKKINRLGKGDVMILDVSSRREQDTPMDFKVYSQMLGVHGATGTQLPVPLIAEGAGTVNQAYQRNRPVLLLREGTSDSMSYTSFSPHLDQKAIGQMRSGTSVLNEDTVWSKAVRDKVVKVGKHGDTYEPYAALQTVDYVSGLLKNVAAESPPRLTGDVVLELQRATNPVFNPTGSVQFYNAVNIVIAPDQPIGSTAGQQALENLLRAPTAMARFKALENFGTAAGDGFEMTAQQVEWLSGSVNQSRAELVKQCNSVRPTSYEPAKRDTEKLAGVVGAYVTPGTEIANYWERSLSRVNSPNNNTTQLAMNQLAGAQTQPGHTVLTDNISSLNLSGSRSPSQGSGVSNPSGGFASFHPVGSPTPGTAANYAASIASTTSSSSSRKGRVK